MGGDPDEKIPIRIRTRITFTAVVISIVIAPLALGEGFVPASGDDSQLRSLSTSVGRKALNKQTANIPGTPQILCGR